MEETKRLRNNSFDENINNKRQKLNISTVETNFSINEYISVLEDLPNELIYEIFEHLESHQAFDSFYNLNIRFRNLLIPSNNPIRIHISSISKSSFQDYSTQMITPYANKIQSFQLSNQLSTDMSILIYPAIEQMTELETLIIHNIQSHYIVTLINQLFSLPVLSTLVITSAENTKHQNHIYQKIFRLPTLKYCQLLIASARFPLLLPVCMNQHSTIEHLSIKHEVSIGQLNGLLSYVPHLHRLSLDCLTNTGNISSYASAIPMNNLIRVSLKIKSIPFNDFEALATKFFRSIRCLSVYVECLDYFHIAMIYLDADRWEKLITTYMPNLQIFDYQHRHCAWSYERNRQSYEMKVNKFNSKFWNQHQWFFEHQYFEWARSDTAVLYSRKPHRQDYYMLCQKPLKYWHELRTTLTEVSDHHVFIHVTSALEQFSGHLPHVNELTLTKSLGISRSSVTTILNRMATFKQLTKLNLQCPRLYFMYVMEILHLIPNVRTLQLDSILFFGKNSTIFERNEIFEKVSRTNVISSLTIQKTITLDKIELVIALFPRLQYFSLAIHTNKQDLEIITQYILWNSIRNIRPLCILCIRKQCFDSLKRLTTLIDKEQLLRDYSINLIKHKLYLWW